MNDEHFTALTGNWEAGPLFDGREKAVIRWARALTLNEAREDDEAFAGMKGHFSEREIVELTLFTCLFNAWNRLQDGFHNEPEPVHERVQWQAWEEGIVRP
ncbi:MAG: hypothetical protein AABZ64_05170 [Nitrospinota bacterium]